MESAPAYTNTDLLHRKSAIITRYLDRLVDPESPDISDQIIADVIADQIHLPGKALNKTVVIIPVAAASEQTTVGPAIDQYARQQPLEPFSIVLGLNTAVAWGAGSSDIDPSVAETMHIVEAAKLRHPGLDIRSSFLEYDAPRIGAIRRDLWNGVLTVYRRDGMSDTQEMVGINHDIDTVHIPRQYIGVVQTYYENPIQALQPVATQLRHAWDPAHPLTSKAVMWMDFANGQNQAGYEAGTVIPMSFYAEKGGISAADRTNEINNLTRTYKAPELLKTGRLLTSPRRFVDRLPEAGRAAVWTTDSFGADDDCRSPDYVAMQPDLSRDGLIRALHYGLVVDMQRIIANEKYYIDQEFYHNRAAHVGKKQAVSKAEVQHIVTSHVTKRLDIARRVMSLCEPDGFTEYSKALTRKAYQDEIDIMAIAMYQDKA